MRSERWRQEGPADARTGLAGSQTTGLPGLPASSPPPRRERTPSHGSLSQRPSSRATLPCTLNPSSQSSVMGDACQGCGFWPLESLQEQNLCESLSPSGLKPCQPSSRMPGRAPGLCHHHHHTGDPLAQMGPSRCHTPSKASVTTAVGHCAPLPGQCRRNSRQRCPESSMGDTHLRLGVRKPKDQPTPGGDLWSPSGNQTQHPLASVCPSRGPSSTVRQLPGELSKGPVAKELPHPPRPRTHATKPSTRTLPSRLPHYRTGFHSGLPGRGCP